MTRGFAVDLLFSGLERVPEKPIFYAKFFLRVAKLFQAVVERTGRYNEDHVNPNQVN